MKIQAILRTQSGSKKHVTMAGYNGPEDLAIADTVIRSTYPKVRTVLFLIPKQESKL